MINNSWKPRYIHAALMPPQQGLTTDYNPHYNSDCNLWYNTLRFFAEAPDGSRCE